MCAVERVAREVPDAQAEDLRSEMCRILLHVGTTEINMTVPERMAMRELCSNESIVVLPAEKGKATVEMDNLAYKMKIDEILTDWA